MTTDPAIVFRSKVRQYRQLGYEMIEVDEQAYRAKVRVAVSRTSGSILQRSTAGRHDIYRLI